MYITATCAYKAHGITLKKLWPDDNIRLEPTPLRVPDAAYARCPPPVGTLCPCS